nr:hypothetical protein Iba_chr02aCG6200 [Ipomoea batatas]GMC57574.1 hypothetical protein Iba_chr02aCG6980 [Ipomoea batatas]
MEDGYTTSLSVLLLQFFGHRGTYRVDIGRAYFSATSAHTLHRQMECYGCKRAGRSLSRTLRDLVVIGGNSQEIVKVKRFYGTFPGLMAAGEAACASSSMVPNRPR